MSRRAYDAIAGISALTLGAVIVWAVLDPVPSRAESASAAAALPAEPVSLAGAPILGEPTAPIGMIVFSDFQCPFSRTFALHTLPAITERFIRQGTLQVAFRHLPLDGLHPSARAAAELSDCARRQGRFWQVHDAMFRDDRRLGGDWLPRVIARAGFTEAALASCVREDAAATVEDDVEQAAALGITSTPTILLGRLEPERELRVLRRFQGALSADRVGREIEGLTVPGREP